MKAIIFDGTGGPEVIKPTERTVPSPNKDELLIEVKAAGVNRPDVMQRKGMYDPPPGATDIPGLEVSGEVVERGASSLPFSKGDRVCALLPGGGYAEYAVVNANNAALLPEGMTYAEGAAIPETFMTVWSHLFQFAEFKADKSILIHGGASGIGTTATMLTRAWGASQIITTVSNKNDQKASLNLGADAAINYRTQDFVKEVEKETDGMGVDFILDIIAGDYVQRNYEAAAMFGTILQVGIMHGKSQEVNLFPMLSKRLTHLGMTLRSQTPTEKAGVLKGLQKNVWPMMETGKIKPQIAKTFKLSEARAAHEFMEQERYFGKLVLITE